MEGDTVSWGLGARSRQRTCQVDNDIERRDIKYTPGPEDRDARDRNCCISLSTDHARGAPTPVPTHAIPATDLN